MLGGEGSERPVMGLRMAAALGWFWSTHGHATEGARWLAQALARAGASAPLLLRGRAAHVLGILLSQRGDLSASEERFRAGLELFRQAGDQGRQAASLNSPAANARERGDLDAARRLFSEALAIRRRQGERRALADPLSNLGVVAMDAGDLEEAEALLQESLQIDREHGNGWGVALNLSNLGALALERGEPSAAARLLADALGRLRTLGDRSLLLQTLDRCAALAAVTGAAQLAARLAGAADAHRARYGEERTPPGGGTARTPPYPARGALTHEEWRSSHSAGAALELDQALEEALQATAAWASPATPTRFA